MNEARRDIPSTIICTGFPSEQVKAYAEEHNPAWLGGLAELLFVAETARDLAKRLRQMTVLRCKPASAPDVSPACS
jgi:hypothetical protein